MSMWLSYWVTPNNEYSPVTKAHKYPKQRNYKASRATAVHDNFQVAICNILNQGTDSPFKVKYKEIVKFFWGVTGYDLKEISYVLFSAQRRQSTPLVEEEEEVEELLSNNSSQHLLRHLMPPFSEISW